MNQFWRIAPWLTRVLLLVPAALFGFLGWRYMSQPITTAAIDRIALGSGAAVTDMRVVGALFAACGLITTYLLSTKRLLAGMGFVVTVIGVVTAARAFGLWTDGPAPGTVSKLTTETVLLAVFLVGGALELARHRHEQHGVTRAS